MHLAIDASDFAIGLMPGGAVHGFAIFPFQDRAINVDAMTLRKR